MTYVPKNYWMICDRCGGQFRRSEMKKEWTNLWVCTRGCWEPRHPQDFVKSKVDNPSVPVARPDVVTDMRTTTVKVAAVKGDLTVDVASTSGITTKTPIGIVLDDSSVHWTYVNGTPAGDTVTLGTRFWSAAAIGNTVYVGAVDGHTYI